MSAMSGNHGISPPRRRMSRVSFASANDEDRLSSPEKGAGSATEDMPASPCRGRRNSRSTYSFGGRGSMGPEGAPADEASTTLPDSPPESPGRLRQAWKCMKQLEDELEAKQHELEEWDFELKEEKRQQTESRLFFARKMSELEARELRAARDEERRLNGGTPSPTTSRTPPSSGRRLLTPLRGTPESGCPFSSETELSESTSQTDEAAPTSASEADCHRKVGKRRCCSRTWNFCKCLCGYVVALQVFVKVCIITHTIAEPFLPGETVDYVASWLPVSLETFMLLDISSANKVSTMSGEDLAVPGLADRSCHEALSKMQLVLSKMQQQQTTPLQMQQQPVAQQQPVQAPVVPVQAPVVQQAQPELAPKMPSPVGAVLDPPSPSQWGWRVLSFIVIGALAAVRSCV